MTSLLIHARLEQCAFETLRFACGCRAGRSELVYMQIRGAPTKVSNVRFTVSGGPQNTLNTNGWVEVTTNWNLTGRRRNFGGMLRDESLVAP